MSLKNLWFLISWAPFAPSLNLGSFWSSFSSKSFQSADIPSGISILCFRIKFKISLFHPDGYGRSVVSIRYITIPKLHQSTMCEYILSSTISGAKYFIVPHAEFFTIGLKLYLERPKSINLICPSSSRSMFCGLRSR